MGKRIDFDTLAKKWTETDKNIINLEQQIEQLKQERTKLVRSRSAVNKKIKLYVKEFLQQLFYEHHYPYIIEKITIYADNTIGIDGFDKYNDYNSRQVEFEKCSLLDLSTLSAKLIDDGFFLRVIPKTFQEKYLSEL